MLSDLNLGDGNNLGTENGKIALDCSVRKTRQGHYVISTTDFFFPLVDSPYLQGRIGAANVLSDLYAEGVQQCDFVLMLLASCRDMPEDERTICTKYMVKGFQDTCKEAETVITGGQTVLNPWPIIGGVATSIVSEKEYIPSNGAQIGNIVVLTKPLGTQIAVNVHQWRKESMRNHGLGVDDGGIGSGISHPLWRKCIEQQIITIEEAERMMHDAICNMVRLNKYGGSLMLKYNATAGTDVTGFGILGHAQNLMENQKCYNMTMEIHTLPVIANTKKVNDTIFNFQLSTGYSAETSGGLLVCFPSLEAAESYRQELKVLDGPKAESWIIGEIVKQETGAEAEAASSSSSSSSIKNNNKAILLEDLKFLEV